MNFLSKINHIPTKYVIGMNIALLAMAVTYVSIGAVSRSTDNRSQAAASPLPTPITTLAIDPNNPPRLFAADPDWAKRGDALIIRGQNLGTTPFGQLSLGDVIIPTQNIIEWHPEYIVITIPQNATNHPLQISFNDNQTLQTTNIIRIVDINQPDL